MCLASAPAVRARRGPLGRAAWAVLGSPLRLFGASASGCAVAAIWLTPPAARLVLAGGAWLLLLGMALEWLPRCSGKSPVHYGRYGTAAYGIGLGLLLLVGMADSVWVTSLGLAALLAGSALAVNAAREHLHWLPRRHERWARPAGWLLPSGGLGLAALALFL